MDLAIVIVNYNVQKLLRRCLQSLFASELNQTFTVCVVDNHSKDNSVEMVRQEFPQVLVIANQENVGYPAANNQGLIALGAQNSPPPRYSLLLNPDTELPPTALADMLRFMDTNPQVGAAGPKLVLPDGSLDLACRRGSDSISALFYRIVGLSSLFPKSPRFGRYNMTYLDENEMAEVDSVVGAFMMVRGTAIAQVGLMDDQFWMYGEDLDWAKRMKDVGWKIVYYPAVQVLHVKRASSKQNPRAQIEFYRAMLIYYYKHFHQQTSWWLHYLVLLGIALQGGRTIWRDVAAGKEILAPASGAAVNQNKP